MRRLIKLERCGFFIFSGRGFSVYGGIFLFLIKYLMVGMEVMYWFSSSSFLFFNVRVVMVIVECLVNYE